MPDDEPRAQAPRSPKAPGQPAGVGVRFGARFLDFLMLALAFGIVVIIASAFLSPDADPGAWWLIGLLAVIANFGYFVYLESSFGATLGKAFLKLRTVAPDGRKPTTRAAIVRNAWVLVGVIPFVGGLAGAVIGIWIAISIGNDAGGRGIHDRWAGGTAVIRAG